MHFDEHLHLAANETLWILTIQNAYRFSLSIKCELLLSVVPPKLKIHTLCTLMSIFILLLMKRWILTIQNAYRFSVSIKCELLLSVVPPKLKIHTLCTLMSIFILLLMKRFGY